MKSITELRAHECRWPVQSDTGLLANHLFCGGPTDQDQSYCSAHRALAYLPAKRYSGHGIEFIAERMEPTTRPEPEERYLPLTFTGRAA